MLTRHVASKSPRIVSRAPESIAKGRQTRRNHTLALPRVFSCELNPAILPSSSTPSPGLSDLGLRSSLPPDSSSTPKPSQNPNGEDSPISDQEWEIRTGRAIYVLQETLPTFFNTGLITSIDPGTNAPRPATSLHLPLANAHPKDWQIFHDDLEGIYSRNMKLRYRPPVKLPAPFPKVLHVEGLPMYTASSAFVRHTMNALYSDLQVVTTKVVVNTSPRTPSTSSSPSSSSECSDSKKRKLNRDKTLFIRLNVTGTARVSGSAGEWEVNSTYTFSPLSGLIHLHVVDSIEPAPHQAVYDSLRMSLGKVFGLGWHGGGVGGRLGGTRDGGGMGTPTACAKETLEERERKR
ncbi:hypothetical protein BDQ12DRAFT_362618 [Crucibulum laeve]|uniref:Uncharacterized protein n=1 Tax=Crucibulum laeve TaxID=68775 RepID=A0A5C3LPG3_9AGAR|nr:hypothetical protein BDQ12DRAFT_362618 [Crucibulum laeve]